MILTVDIQVRMCYYQIEHLNNIRPLFPVLLRSDQRPDLGSVALICHGRKCPQMSACLKKTLKTGSAHRDRHFIHYPSYFIPAIRVFRRELGAPAMA